MGEENPIRKPKPENPKNRLDARGERISAGGSSAGGESTVDGSAKGVAAARAEDRICVGPYVLIRKLGEGGMGQVWLAEQEAPVKRLVALKLIKGGLYDSAVLQRFESERQTLAIMNHPAIAKVFDAGSTNDGQPYFVMEYVDGLPISRYCDNKKLQIRERLELFIKICEGVQHAHQKAIIHRDLKPSNILVVEVDGKATPRIIDFGVAKAISTQSGAEQTQFTEIGALVGTRGFMSPEQADPSVLDVDTRSDVYSLGAVLYVLLTGMLPFDSEAGKKKPIDEMLRQLREEDPPSPSSKVSTGRETATAAAERRGTRTKHLVKSLQGDLDWITMKAVDKDRAQRYGTPSELAADIERYIENRPVVARPASKVYRLKKYVQRYRLAVAAISGAALLLVAFAITQAVQLRRTTRERDRANRITEFMTNMFKVSDPSEAKGNAITAREILDRASKDIDSGLAKDPELQAQMMAIMGDVYDNLGLYPRAQLLQQHTMEVRQRVLGLESPDTLRAMHALAWILEQQGHYAEAEKLQRKTLDVQRRVLGPEHPDTLATTNDLATVLNFEGHYAEAERLDRDTLNVQMRILGPENANTLGTMQNLASVLTYEVRYAEAERLDRETLGIRRRTLGPEHPSTLGTMHNLASILSDEGRYAEAEKLDRETLGIRLRVLGPEHPDTLTTMHNLASYLNQEGHYAEAEKLHRETFDVQRRVLGPEHPNTLESMSNWASDLTYEGHYAEAEKLQRETLDIRRRVLGPEHPDTLISMNNLADTLMKMGEYGEADKVLKQALDIQRRILAPESPDTATTVYNLGSIAAHRGQRDEAFSRLGEAVDHGLPPSDALGIDKDPDLKSLHGDPHFDALVAHAKARAAAQKPN
jgi:non-specific serine/threonine protein kinase/serine/threonine-protein kinase